MVVIGVLKSKTTNQQKFPNNQKNIKTYTNKNNQSINNSAKQSSTSSLLLIDNPLIDENFIKEINEGFEKLKENIKIDNNKNEADYQREISNWQKEFLKQYKKTKILDYRIILKFAEELSLINPPPRFYDFHLELLKTFYSVGIGLKKYQETDDIFLKNYLYNFIRDNLEKLKVK